MADLYASARKPISLYKDRRYGGDLEEREVKLKHSTTLYVGNLSFYTREEQIFDLFSRVGEVKRIIMGLDRIRKTPCGFCFVEYFTRTDAEKSVHFISGTKLDERTIRVDYDVGYSVGRQYGRGRSGGQVRDEYRNDYDPGRGGYGKAIAPQTGMSGMDLWSSQGGPPDGQAPPIHGNRGMPFGGPRGRGRGRGRYGRGRGRGYGPPGPGYGYQDGFQDGYNHGPPHGAKRRREFDGGEQFGHGGSGYQSMAKRSRVEHEYRGEANGVSPGRRGPPHNRMNDRPGPMRVDSNAQTNDRLNGSEPARNARFDRGKKDDAE